MADGISADFSELDRLAVNLGRASSALIAGARPVVKRGLDNIKMDTRKNITSIYWQKLKPKVNYEIIGLEGEVGYDDDKQGELAGIYEFGSVLAAPHPTLYPAAAREAPRFEKALGDLAAKVAL